jgi:hypothetical protein
VADISKRARLPKTQRAVDGVPNNPALPLLHERPLTLEQVPNKKQRAWARRAAGSVERGKLPRSSMSREGIASILRAWADQSSAPPPTTQPKKRGNPDFARNKKLPDRAAVAVDVAFRIASGKNPADAYGELADKYGASMSTVTKAFYEHAEAAVRAFIMDPIQARRVLGAIRRK